MRKYLAILSTQIQNSFQYRGQLFFWTINDVLYLTVLFFLWQAVFQDRGMVGQYTFATLITYYVTVFIVEMLASSFNEFNMESIVRDGKLTKYLTRPMSFFWYRFVSDWGWKLTRLVVTLPLYAIVLFVLQSYIVFPDRAHAFQFIFIIIVASILYFMISYTISYFAFWMLSITSVVGILRAVLIPLFAGSLVPIDLFPPAFQRIMEFLPFQYLIYFPVQVFLGNTTFDDVLMAGVVMSGWICVFSLVSWILWQPALRRYESVGG